MIETKVVKEEKADDSNPTWRAVIYGVTKSRTRLSNWTELMISLNDAAYEVA